MTKPATPKYLAVHDKLLVRLKSNQYSVGTRMPSEEALAQTFDVSRVTIRKSLEMLVGAGYLVARQGSGYHVSSLSPPQVTCLESFTDAVLRAGRVPGARLIGIYSPAAVVPAEVAAHFDAPVTCIQRLRTVDGAPIILVNTWVPTARLPGIAPGAFPESGHGQSILRVLADHFKIEWSRACEIVQPCAATADVAALLDVTPGTPILSQACTAFDDDQRAVFHDQAYRATPITYNLAGSTRSAVPL